jgi:hypothetical protein
VSVDNEELTGQFWMEGSKDKIGGVLKLRDGNSPRLFLGGELTPPFEIVSRDASSVSMGAAKQGPDVENYIIHGNVMGRNPKVTLVGCYTVSQRSTFFGGGPSEQVLDARYALLGDHVNASDLSYTLVALRFSNLDQWAQLDGFSLKRSIDEPGATVTYSSPPTESIRLLDGSMLRIDSEFSGPWQIDPHRMVLERKAWFMIELSHPKDWMELDRLFLRPLKSFMQLCTQRDSQLTGIRVRAAGRMLILIPARLSSTSLPDDWTKFPVLRAHVGLDVLGEWLDIVPDTHPGSSVVSDQFVSRSTTLESDLLQLATVAEAMHRSLFPQQNRLDPPTAKRVYSHIIEAVCREERRVQDVVRGRFSHLEEMSYAHRLRDLASEAELALPGVTGRSRKWVDLIYGARNTFAHGTGGQLAESEIDKYFIGVSSLKWVLWACLLLTSGVPPETLRERASACQRYRLFLSQAHSLMPDIYPR